MLYRKFLSLTIWFQIDEDDDEKSIKVVWTYAKKATKGNGEESGLHDF